MSTECRFDIEKTANESLCMHCGRPYINYISPCGHLFHLDCFAFVYFYTKSCCCKRPLIINSLRTQNTSECYLCASKFNLISCQYCQIVYCYPCMATKNLRECCNSIKNDIKNAYITCPGCENFRTFNDLALITCGNHALLCKMCWNLSALNKKCLFGCEIGFYGGFSCECLSCGTNSLKHFGEFICENGCEICVKCFEKHYLNTTSYEGKDRTLKCVYCGKVLVPKQFSWV